jgi:cobalt-zinc-cadmium efflux system outer membrane protein
MYRSRQKLLFTGVCLLTWGASLFAQTNGPHISLDQAVDLALSHNHSLQAARTEILQNEAQEITAGLRPNPTLSGDAQFIPLFSPNAFSSDYLDQGQQFDIGFGYLFERGQKRRRRLQVARDQTAVTRSQIADMERTTTFNVAQQFVSVLLAESVLDFATQDLKDFQQVVEVGEAQYKAGAISEGDYLKIKLQLLQFQTDVSSAHLARVQALISLRALLGYDAVAADFDVMGDLAYRPVTSNLIDLQARALRERPDLKAAQMGVIAAESQIKLAQANGKQDITSSLDYTHVGGVNSASLFMSMPLPIFDRNQGEIARTRFALTQAQQSREAASETVLGDISSAYESVRSNNEVVQLYISGYLKQAQDSREITGYAYHRGAVGLLDFLDAERSYRATQLAYRQALASYMTAVEQLKAAAGTRSLP